MTSLIPAYQDVVRKPNVLRTRNPLKHTTSNVVPLASRINDLQTSKDWQKLIKEYQTSAVMLNPDLRPRVAMVKLGELTIDEDIQRALDDKHCAKKIADPSIFDPALLQTIQCIKTSKGDFISIDGQHTVATVAALIDAGLVPGITDWKEFKFPFQYIETDNLAYRGEKLPEPLSKEQVRDAKINIINDGNN
mgnify:CR=1 FL=1